MYSYIISDYPRCVHHLHSTVGLPQITFAKLWGGGVFRKKREVDNMGGRGNLKKRFLPDDQGEFIISTFKHIILK